MADNDIRPKGDGAEEEDLDLVDLTEKYEWVEEDNDN